MMRVPLRVISTVQFRDLIPTVRLRDLILTVRLHDLIPKNKIKCRKYYKIKKFINSFV